MNCCLFKYDGHMTSIYMANVTPGSCCVEYGVGLYSLCYAIDYTFIFVSIGLSLITGLNDVRICKIVFVSCTRFGRP